MNTTVENILMVVGGAVAAAQAYNWASKWGSKPSEFKVEKDAPYPIEFIWEEFDNPSKWRNWMYGTWQYSDLSTRDTNIKGAVELGASHRECDIYIPLNKIAIKNDEFSLIKLGNDKTRIKYKHMVEHDGLIDKLIWYLGEYWLGKWNLHEARMVALMVHLKECKNV